jgi:hypothetical protein
VTIHEGMSWDRQRLPTRFVWIVDGQEPHHVLLRVSGGVTGLWPAEVMFDSEGKMFLHNGWRRFTRSHSIDVSVKVFDETMSHRHYHSDADG